MYVKRVELCNFKSFGGTTSIPLLPGFTVVSGPNGSGKSNILDALLFALGLSSSKGMRAERLPDLVNQNQAGRNRTVEASVSVTFDSSDELENLLQLDDEAEVGAPTSMIQVNGNGAGQGSELGSGLAGAALLTARDWMVTRRLRVTPQGTYTSNYFINGEACTLAELHEQLQRFRIYPEGYNIVLQGDVTSIISMNSRERRVIIDELAGVAAFDRKIDQARGKLDQVQEREERFRIVEQELITQRDRLAQDRIKAEKYQKLRMQLQEQAQWEGVLNWRSQHQRSQRIEQELAAGEQAWAALSAQLTALDQTIQQTTATLEQLNAHVKAMGEEEHIALQSQLATQEAEQRQLQRQVQDLNQQRQQLDTQISQLQQDAQQHGQAIAGLTQTQQQLQGDRQTLQADCSRLSTQLEQQREAASAIAAHSEAWVQAQTELRHRIDATLGELEPQRTEQARLQERSTQLRLKIQEQTRSLEILQQTLKVKRSQATHLQGAQFTQAEQAIQAAAQVLAQAEQELQTQQETRSRLLQEQREKQRQLDKLEAQTQAMQESQGTYATELILKMGLPGVCGLVAQLGRVDATYQLALEIAAGGRLGCLVVEDDGVAAAGIELLKRERAGRVTFLPLNKIRAPRLDKIAAWQRPPGFIDYAVDLLDCDDRYRDIFAFVFGNTAVFDRLEAARAQLGQYRIVTLQGDLLETSGAMTGGSVAAKRGSLHFGAVEAGESEEAKLLRDRLTVIDKILARCELAIATATQTIKEQTRRLTELRQQHREQQLQTDQFTQQIQQLTEQEQQTQRQIEQLTHELRSAEARLGELEQTIPVLSTTLTSQRQALAELEQSQAHSEWQQIQTQVRQLEIDLQQRQLALRSVEQRLQDLANQSQRLQEKIQQGQQQIQASRAQQTQYLQQIQTLTAQHQTQQQAIAQTQAAIAVLDQTLATERQRRDAVERQLREQHTQQQNLGWQRQKVQETQQQRQQELETLTQHLVELRATLPDPLPDIPATLTLEELQKDLRSLQRRLEAMEPVNMLALEEYDRTQARLEELTQKLTTLEEERTELLLRVENFTTLRRQAFREAFDAVNQNFQAIFAELSDGDGHLQLEDAEDPFNGGLNLVAHPKGKLVRRLASMSGGEKSLTALSFIFALQRYRPSPFYSFDEVDMFLDGANVERLSKMIRHQAQQAQFIVVSLRRPMIEASDRTIGVTQARGAYTQVLGISLQEAERAASL